MNSHQAVVRALRQVLEDMGRVEAGQVLLPGPDQMQVNALGIALAYRWARSSVSSMARLHTYACEHQNGRTSHFEGVPALDRVAIEQRWHRYSFLADVFFEEWVGPKAQRRELPVLAAEIEAYPQHGTDDDIDKNDYQWDFYKLLHVIAPKRLFVACTRVERIDAVAASLVAARERTRRATGLDADRLAVVLLPAGERQWQAVRVGIAKGRGPLEMGA